MTLHDTSLRKTAVLRVAVEAGGIGAILKVRAAEAKKRGFFSRIFSSRAFLDCKNAFIVHCCEKKPRRWQSDSCSADRSTRDGHNDRF